MLAGSSLAVLYALARPAKKGPARWNRTTASRIMITSELMVDRSVFHCDLHFSSNRATVWSQADPYRYRILTIDELIDPDVCLTFPKTPYPDSAVVQPG